MRIIEARDGFIKVESNDKLSLSSFLQINDNDAKYIAQIIQIKHNQEKYTLFAKLLFLYDGTFSVYDKTLPSKSAEVCVFDFEIFNKYLNNKKPLIIGNFIEKNQEIIVDTNTISQKTLVCIDNNENNKIITTNIANQYENSIIIDMLGLFDFPKYTAGIDFKLPLNTDALNFLFEDCLNDATSDSKSLIKEIFEDLSEYSKTVPFVPFAALKTIIDDMVDRSHIFRLLVLKNKLAKFEKLGYFAASKKDVENLDNILQTPNAVIDLSKLDSTFQNRYLSIILSSIKKQENKPQIFVEVSNNINKKNLKDIVTGILPTTVVLHSRFKYINEIKSMFKNFIIEPSFTNNTTFKPFAMLLNAMQKNSCLIIGEATSNIPLVSSIIKRVIEQKTELIDLDSKDALLEEIQKDSSPQNASVIAIEKKSTELIEKVSEEIYTDKNNNMENLFEEEDENETILPNETEDKNLNASSFEKSAENDIQLETELELEEPGESEELIQEETLAATDALKLIEDIEVSNEYNETIQIDTTNEYANDTNSLDNDIREEDIEIQITEDDLDESFDAVVELEDNNIEEVTDAILEENIETIDDEALDKAIVEDVDKVFTTMKDDSLSDSDLDFIDELNNNSEDEEIILSDGMEEIIELEENNESEEDFLEPLEEINESSIQLKNEEREILQTKSSSTPNIPVYSAEIPPEDMVISDDIDQGDTVVHAKYGNGVVEKMIKYGTKTLYSINFDNIGRRLLDPTLTEIRKR